MTTYVRLWEILETVELHPMVSDRFVWRWSPSGSYTASLAYRSFFVGTSSLQVAKELWSATVPPKTKFLFWLAIKARLWTAERRNRHGLHCSNKTTALCVIRVQKKTRSPVHVMRFHRGDLVSRPYHNWFADGCTRRGRRSGDLVDGWMRTRARLPQCQRKACDSMVILI